MLCYDGGDSAVIVAPDQRVTSCLAFDPRSLGIATGLFSDLTLKENIAYHTGKEIALTRPKNDPAKPEFVTIEMTDRFAQKIRFDVQPRSPFRVYHYSKTIPAIGEDGIFAQYVTEAEYQPDDADGWLPRKLTMYTLPVGDPFQRIDEAVVEFERPEFVDGFDPDVWTVKGLSLPIGQPLADLRIKKRIGYWNGRELVEDLP